MINHVFISFSAVQLYDISYIHLHHLRVYYEVTMWPAPSWLDSSVGRALHRYRRGYGFESRSSLNFFQALISQLLKLYDCDDQSCLHIFLRSSDKWYFIYSLASKVNCHKTSQRGNNRTNVWIETQKLKTLKKLNTWWFQTISVFETSLYFYKMWVWNTIFRTGIKRNKPFSF